MKVAVEDRVPGRAVATPELEQALGLVLAGDRHSVRVLERHAIPYRSTFPLEELHVRHGDGREEWLVWKDLSRDGPADPVWSVKPAFLRDPTREIATYRHVLGPLGIAAPRYRGAIDDPARGRHWLFLERVVGDPLWQRGEESVWQGAARWLAGFHARGSDRHLKLPLGLLRYDAPYYRRWLTRARRFVRWPDVSKVGRRDFDWLAARVLAATAWLDDQPLTLLHGEFYPSNVLVEPAADGSRLWPVDWEMAGVGPGLLDLAALVSGIWSGADRALLCDAYRSALPAALRPSEVALRAGLDRCRLLLAVQWLGWSPGWNPPREHAHDWLTTALELAARLRA